MHGRHISSTDRRGVAAVVAALALVVLLGFTALAVDMSWLVSARDQLQAATDNTAISAARYISARGLPESVEERQEIAADAIVYANAFNPENPVEVIPTVPDSVELGLAIWEGDIFQSRVLDVDPDPDYYYYDAVKVTTTMRQNGTPAQDQELPSFFGTIFGKDHYEPVAEAIALLNINGGALLPFTVRWNVWDVQADLNTPPVHDDWSDSGLEEPDGIPEVWIYPKKFDSATCTGNFGSLNIAVTNQGLPPFAAQVRYGVTFAELAEELGGMEAVDALINADCGWIGDDLQTQAPGAGDPPVPSGTQVVSPSANFSSLVTPGYHMLDIGEGVLANGDPAEDIYHPDQLDVGLYPIASVTNSTTLELGQPLTQTAPHLWYRIHDPNEGFKITATPGISFGKPLRDALDDRIGDIVGIFIHNGSAFGGSGCEFNIICIRFGRLLYYDHAGNDNNKRIVVQPVPPPDPSTLEGSITYLGLGK